LELVSWSSVWYSDRGICSSCLSCLVTAVKSVLVARCAQLGL
jgi:hypothetical protein